MRVLATMNRSSLSSQMQSQQDNLTQWVDEILTGVWGYQVRYSVVLRLEIWLKRWGPAAGQWDAPELR
jgi:hypothetical protein